MQDSRKKIDANPLRKSWRMENGRLVSCWVDSAELDPGIAVLLVSKWRRPSGVQDENQTTKSDLKY